MENNKAILFCGRTDNPEYPYNHFFGTEFQVRMCGFGTKNIAKVELEETTDPDSIYWGYKDFRDNQYHFVAPSKFQVTMCSPDSFQNEIQEGRGKLVRLKVTELNR